MKNTLVIDLDRCSGCDSCVAACKMENQMNLGVVRNHVSAVGPVGTFPDIEMYWLPMQCQQCENPGCIEVCPTGASYRDEETGIVLVNAEDCIGCESCLTGCPYGVRQLNPKTNTIEKCTLCFQRKNDENWVPACVHNCCCGARTFGDLDDPNSEAAKVVAAAGALPVRSGRPASHDGLHPLGEDRQVAGGARRGHPLREEVAILREGCACTSP